MTRTLNRAALFLAITACLFTAPLGAEPALEIADVAAGTSALVFQPTFAVEKTVLTVAGPAGTVRYEFDGSATPSFDLFDAEGYAAEDGSYTWELRATPALDASMKDELAYARATGDMTRVQSLQRSGYLPNEELVQTGSFRVIGGSIVQGGATEPEAPRSASGAATAGAPAGIQSTNAAAQVYTTDLIVQGSECVGFDCTTSESFGSDTFRLKENNLRIHFNDTSASASFPGNDWRITINESINGGIDKFSIDDVTNNKIPFLIKANAPTNALYIKETSGDIGMGTAAPVVELHVTDGDSPTLRLEQDGSSGFQSQTWDIAGNETNFFVRDVTNGSKLPFKIRPGAADNSVYINNNSNVGIGYDKPSSPLHVRRTDGSAMVKIEDTGAAENLLLVESAGVSTRLVMENTNDTSCTAGVDCSWSMGMRQNSNFFITRDGSGTDECTLDTAGNFSCTGTVSGASSRTLKDNIFPVNTREMLARVLTLPVTEWTYIKELEKGTRHVGPIAEDFYALFSLGNSEKALAATDAAGVALAAIQGLHQVVEENDSAIEQELRRENERLSARLAALEAMVSALVNQ